MVKQTTYHQATVISLAALVVLLVVVLIVNGGFGVDPASSARSTVEQFGRQMQKVSLLAPDASSTIATVYSPYATPEIIVMWQSDLENAPGKLTSSPWPDHIDILQIAKDDDGAYEVQGKVIEVTSTGPANTYQIALKLRRQADGKLLITGFTKIVAQ